MSLMEDPSKEDKDYFRYRDDLYYIWIAVTVFMIIGGIIAAGIVSETGHRFIAGYVFWGGLFASMVTGSIAYFTPLMNLKKRIAYLDKRCTVSVKGRCIRSGETSYYQARLSKRIAPFYRKPDDGTSETDERSEIYYDPEYSAEYEGKVYHLCEKRLSVYPVAEDSERILRVDPEEPEVFYDENRYAAELKMAKENSREGFGIMIKLFIGVFIVFAISEFIR